MELFADPTINPFSTAALEQRLATLRQAQLVSDDDAIMVDICAIEIELDRRRQWHAARSAEEE